MNYFVTVLNVPFVAIILFVIIFGLLALGSGIWFWYHHRNEEKKRPINSFETKQKVKIWEAFNKNKFFILFMIFLCAFLGSLGVLIHSLSTGQPI